jgi:hypothetical protein
LVVVRSWRKERMQKKFLNKYRVFFWGDENALKLDRGEGCISL